MAKRASIGRISTLIVTITLNKSFPRYQAATILAKILTVNGSHGVSHLIQIYVGNIAILSGTVTIRRIKNFSYSESMILKTTMTPGKSAKTGAVT